LVSAVVGYYSRQHETKLRLQAELQAKRWDLEIQSVSEKSAAFEDTLTHVRAVLVERDRARLKDMYEAFHRAHYAGLFVPSSLEESLKPLLKRLQNVLKKTDDFNLKEASKEAVTKDEVDGVLEQVRALQGDLQNCFQRWKREREQEEKKRLDELLDSGL